MLFRRGGDDAGVSENGCDGSASDRPEHVAVVGLQIVRDGRGEGEDAVEALLGEEAVGVEVDFDLWIKLPGEADDLFDVRKMDGGLAAGEEDSVGAHGSACRTPKGSDTFQGEFLGLEEASHRTGLIGVRGNGPVLAVKALKVATGEKDGVALRGCWVKLGGSDLGEGHATDPGFAGQAVHTASPLAELAAHEIV